jgi:hypothetical protein
MFFHDVRLVNENIKKQVMKRMVFAFAVMLISVTAVMGQRNGIDAFFNRYEGKEGFTTVNISGNLFKLFADTSDSVRNENVSIEISSVRILSINDENITGRINFMEELKNSVDKGGYDELMIVKNAENDVRVMVKTSGRLIKELLVISGGKDNALVQVKGSFEKKDLKKLANGNVDNLKVLEGLEENGN